jgi:nucleotide-binding universal stress UspA family protein
MTPRRVLVPVDFSKCSRAALTYAASKSDRRPTVIDLLYVGRPINANVALHVPTGSGHMSLKDFARASALRDLEHLATSMHVHGPVAIRASVEFGDAADEIIAFARDRGHDEIIMGSHSQAARSELRLGAVADRVAREAPCPVITVSGDQPKGDWAARVAQALELRRPALAPASDIPVKWID